MMKTKSTKRALVLSALSLLLCVSMLIGSTYAWFTDSVTSAGNIIQSGRLDIALEYSTDGGNTWADAEGKTLDFKTADNRTTEILWEPGCTYELPLVRVRNNGNLALKYQIVINGVTGSAKLLEAIDFTANGNAITTFIGHLDTNGAVSDSIAIKGHMKEEAGNEYQGLTIEGIGITVYATQYTYESDSFDNKYDQMGDGLYHNGTFAAGPINSGRTMGNNGRYQIAADLTNVSGVKTLAVNVLDQYGKLMTTITPEGYQIPADGKIGSTTLSAVVVGDSSSWQNTPFFPTLNAVPTTMELVVNGAVIGVTGVKPLEGASPVSWAEIVDAYYDANDVEVIETAGELTSSLQAAASAGAGDSILVLSEDIDMTGSAWTPISVDGYHGAGVITIEGNGATIKGLTAPLFKGGFAGKSGIVIRNLTIADSNIVSTSGLGGGAFIDTADSMHVITLENCHLVNSTVQGERTGGLIGWCSGYAKLNDGPVKAYVTISNCSVVNSDVIGAGSAGAIAGHPGASDYTYTTIEDCKVKNVDVISNDDGDWRTGAVVGTANNGHIVINNVTVEGVTLTQNGVTKSETVLYGRFVPAGTGTLVIDGVAVQ